MIKMINSVDNMGEVEECKKKMAVVMIHTHTHTNTYTYIHTYTHTHTLWMHYPATILHSVVSWALRTVFPLLHVAYQNNNRFNHLST